MRIDYQRPAFEVGAVPPPQFPPGAVLERKAWGELTCADCPMFDKAAGVCRTSPEAWPKDPGEWCAYGRDQMSRMTPFGGDAVISAAVEWFCTAVECEALALDDLNSAVSKYLARTDRDADREGATR